eukprot:749368-Hanusia_phi.AAC.1
MGNLQIVRSGGRDAAWRDDGELDRGLSAHPFFSTELFVTDMYVGGFFQQVQVYPRKRNGDGKCESLTLVESDITSLFHLSQKDAAKHLGISLTAFKNACKKLRIPSWPSSRGSTAKSQGTAEHAVHGKDVDVIAVSSEIKADDTLVFGSRPDEWFRSPDVTIPQSRGVANDYRSDRNTAATQMAHSAFSITQSSDGISCADKLVSDRKWFASNLQNRYGSDWNAADKPQACYTFSNAMEQANPTMTNVFDPLGGQNVSQNLTASNHMFGFTQQHSNTFIPVVNQQVSTSGPNTFAQHSNKHNEPLGNSWNNPAAENNSNFSFPSPSQAQPIFTQNFQGLAVQNGPSNTWPFAFTANTPPSFAEAQRCMYSAATPALNIFQGPAAPGPAASPSLRFSGFT